MKKSTLISLALLTMISGTAFSHQIYYVECDERAGAEAAATGKYESDSKTGSINTAGLDGIMGPSGKKVSINAVKCYSDRPELRALRAENPNTPESDRVAAMTFCQMGGFDNPVECASDVINKGLVEEAKGCIDSIIASVNSFAITPIAHQLGGNGSGSGVWHQHYVHSKEDGWHRHDWSKDARDLAGKTFAVAQVELERKLRETNSRTDSKSTTSGAETGISGTVGVNGGVASVELGGSAGVNGSNEKGTSTEKGPLTQKEIDQLRDKYYKIGYDAPHLGGVNPDIYCNRSEPNCVASSGQVIKNTSYQPESPKKEESRPTKTGSDASGPSHKSSDNDAGSSRAPGSSSQDDYGPSMETTDGGNWAGEPSKPSDGSMWVDFTQEDPGYDPMATCIFNAHREKVKIGSDKTYSEESDTRSPAEKKRDAEAMLKKGLCDEIYYGREYCSHWKKKKLLIDSNEPVKEKPIVEPGEKLSPPGFLHFDPDRVPASIPDHLKDKTGTTPNPQMLPQHIKA